jgi:hypothetical protein
MASLPLLASPLELHLDLPLDRLPAIWDQNQFLSNPTSRWHSYLNQLAIEALQPWLQEDATVKFGLNETARASIWDLVGGTALLVNSQRWIVLPTEVLDLEEVTVPREWLDLPNWVGAMYLFIQVNPDDGWARLLGFATYDELRRWGQLDDDDRTYHLPAHHLTCDLALLQLTASLISAPAVPPVASLDLVQAQSLLTRLSNPSLLAPRLEIPFVQWAALIHHDGWRQQLAERRWGLPEQRSLRQWLQAGLTALAEQSGWRQSVAMTGVRSLAERGELVKSFTLAGDPYELWVRSLDLEANSWRIGVRAVNPDRLIPTGVVLRLLTEDLQPFEGNEDQSPVPVAELFIDMTLEFGEGIVWQIEPTPDEGGLEVLRF